MINFEVAVRTTVLIVDNDIQQLDLLALTMRMSGFSVVTASSPIDAISLMNERSFRKIDVAVIDHHMPVGTDAFWLHTSKPGIRNLRSLCIQVLSTSLRTK